MPLFERLSVQMKRWGNDTSKSLLPMCCQIMELLCRQRVDGSVNFCYSFIVGLIWLMSVTLYCTLLNHDGHGHVLSSNQLYTSYDGGWFCSMMSRWFGNLCDATSQLQFDIPCTTSQQCLNPVMSRCTSLFTGWQFCAIVGFILECNIVCYSLVPETG